MKYIVFGVILIFFIGCGATNPNELLPNKVSHEIQLKYKNYDCNQIKTELFFLHKKEKKLYKGQMQRYNGDSTKIAFSWLYGISLFFLEGDGKVTKNYQNILGKKEYLENLAVRKKCNFIKDTNYLNLNISHDNL